MTSDTDAVRAASWAALTAHGLTGLPVPLPWIDRVPPRPRDEVIARTLALYSVLAIVEGGPLEVVHASLVARGLDQHLSATERRYLDARLRGVDPGERDHANLSWRSESITALGWALGLFDALPLAGHATDEHANAFAPLDPFGQGSGADPAVRLRSEDELYAALDRFYVAHWAVREQQLSGRFEPWPQELVPGAIWERRHALEWIFAPDTPWDEIDLST